MGTQKLFAVGGKSENARDFDYFFPRNITAVRYEPCSVPAASAFRDLTSHSGRAHSDVTDAPRKLERLQKRTEFRTECASEIK